MSSGSTQDRTPQEELYFLNSLSAEAELQYQLAHLVQYYYPWEDNKLKTDTIDFNEIINQEKSIKQNLEPDTLEYVLKLQQRKIWLKLIEEILSDKDLEGSDYYIFMQGMNDIIINTYFMDKED